jgi:hypothetical protein
MDKIADNEAFISLILAALDDEPFKQRLLDLLQGTDAQRRYNMANLITDSKQKGAPVSFLQVLALLTDDAVAHRVIEILKRGSI